jgi:uncharacterized protein with HEPN domain
MQPESRKFLTDVREAARSVSTFTTGRALEDFKTDNLLKSAVYWQFAIIGEALSQLRRIDPPVLPQISESNRIIAFRNQIIHGYSVIDDEITWRIVQDKLPVLLKEVEFLLK